MGDCPSASASQSQARRRRPHRELGQNYKNRRKGACNRVRTTAAAVEIWARRGCVSEERLSWSVAGSPPEAIVVGDPQRFRTISKPTRHGLGFSENREKSPAMVKIAISAVSCDGTAPWVANPAVISAL
ncbi:hypothetical protein TIFTF001_021779 [Ficus carica]|uniref:Uncharacterized protein n=1 Tax=Ficus carica TaxID=3494 RepID=A0AA88ADD0_FICCA|nr:hypothetical protein TIFTF001_021779 [Ficus carica]